MNREHKRTFFDCTIYASNSESFPEQLSAYLRLNDSKKILCSRFQSLTVYVPETYRLVCLRSLIPEQEERSFGDLRSISLNRANRQCGKIIDNAVLRSDDTFLNLI